jgi:predicted transcriptional regulator
MQWPQEFLDSVNAVTAKRPRTVAQHILKHGQITTEELQEIYGYDHPPRAVRDLREQGIPVVTRRTRSTKTGRMIAVYTFGDPNQIKAGRLGGRMAWPKDFKDQLVTVYRCRCGVCLTEYEARYLQIDHRVPFEVSGEPGLPLLREDFMLLCGSCNRAKSWSCEHCHNWSNERKQETCQTCYWSNPKVYMHAALHIIRRLEVVWSEAEVSEYEKLKLLSVHAKTDLPKFVKDIIHKHISG